jgi:outer membrane receptor protein involved in Fe transport
VRENKAATVRLAVLIAATAAGVLAQIAGQGSITGTVIDPTGAVVPNATVVVHDTDTGADRALSTNADGIYTAAFLQIGHYEVTVSKPGFATVQRSGIVLEVGRSLSIDFNLTVQAGAQSVLVVSETPIVDADKTEVSQGVSRGLVENLPIVGRRWDNFVLLTPGVTTDGGMVSYRGISGLYNNNSVDGANNNQAFFSEARGRSTVPYTYSIDSIQEFQVSASNYSAEFGQAAGGVVNAVTKSGTNSPHGDLFYYLRYPSLNSLDPINKAAGILTQGVHQQQQFGGSVGGPAIKNKLFYFFTYDGSRKVFPVSYTSTAFPTTASANLTCPAVISAAQCTAANAFLRGNLGSDGREGVGDVAFGKLDYQLNSSNHISAAFDWNDYHAANSYNASTTINNGSLSQNGAAVTHTRIFVANWDSTISNAIVNNFRFQWGLDNEIIAANGTGPSVSVTNVTGYGLPNALPRPAFPDEHRMQFADTLSWSKGRHLIKVGYDINAIHEVLVNLFQGGGVYSYTSFNNWVEDVFNVNIGDNFTGRHYSSFAQVTDPITHTGKDDFYDNDFAGFFEDSWKVRPNVTLNLGVRYEIQLIPQPPVPNVSTALTAAYTTKINTDSNNFGPRIGIAWEPFRGTVLRAGYGMFYGKTSNSTWYAVRVENGVFQQTFNCVPGTCPALTFPNLIFTPPGGAPAAPFAGAATPQIVPFSPPAGTQLAHGVTTDFVNPLVHEGEFTAEKQLPWGMSISVGYLMSRGLHLPVFLDGNLGPTTATHTYQILNAAGSASVGADTEPWYTVANRLNPTTGILLLGESVINSWYNAGVVTFRKPMSHGVELLFNYTYSKSIDDGAVAGANGTFFGTDPPVDPLNQRRENSLSDLDQRHRFVASVVWIPEIFAKLPVRPVRWLLNGWAVSSVWTLASAQPLFATINGFPSGGADSGLTGGTTTNTGGTTGGRPAFEGRNVYFGHPLYNIDLRAMRQFTYREKYRLQIIAEAFNLFNHTNISSVNTTAFTFLNPLTTPTAANPCSTALAAGANGCLLPSPTFDAPTSSSSSNGLYGARQLQFSAKITF